MFSACSKLIILTCLPYELIPTLKQSDSEANYHLKYAVHSSMEHVGSLYLKVFYREVHTARTNFFLLDYFLVLSLFSQFIDNIVYELSMIAHAV